MTLRPPRSQESSFIHRFGKTRQPEDDRANEDNLTEEEIQANEQVEKVYELRLLYQAEWLMREAVRIAATALPRKKFNFSLTTRHMENPGAAGDNLIVLGWKLSRAMSPEVLGGVEYTAYGLFLSLNGQLWVFDHKNPYPDLPDDKMNANALEVLDTAQAFFEPMLMNGCSRPYTPDGERLEIANANIDTVEKHLTGFRYNK